MQRGLGGVVFLGGDGFLADQGAGAGQIGPGAVGRGGQCFHIGLGFPGGGGGGGQFGVHHFQAGQHRLVVRRLGVIGGGFDLSKDHPVGVSYPSFDGTTYTGAVGGSMNDPTSAAFKANCISSHGPRFSSITGVSTAQKNIVGCGTCHDPHDYRYKYLEAPNNSSYLCLKCHNK